jgi:hypothetical protein
VRAQAAGFGVAFDILLGYAVAHEAGHCVLGPGHAYAGLMRGTWNRKDAGEISRLSLHLTKQESRKAAAILGSVLAKRAVPSHAVTRDGRRFLMSAVVEVSARAPLSVVQNWTGESVGSAMTKNRKLGANLRAISKTGQG